MNWFDNNNSMSENISESPVDDTGIQQKELSIEEIIQQAEMLSESSMKESVDVQLNSLSKMFETSVNDEEYDETMKKINSFSIEKDEEEQNQSDDDDDDDTEYLPAHEVEPIQLWADDSLTKNMNEEDDGKDIILSKTRRNILDVKVPRNMMTNIPTGHSYLDKLMTGTGVTPSTACLVTGTPGSGKSTIMIQVSDCITQTGNIAVYNSNEESDIQLSRVSSRLRLKSGFEITTFKSVFDIVAHVRSIQELAHKEYMDEFNKLKEEGASGKKLTNLRPKQVFLVLDSLQTLEMEHWEYDHKTGAPLLAKNGEPIKKSGPPPKGDTMYLNIARYLSYSWCKTTFGNMFLIGQVTKSGQFAGKQGIKHYVDAHLHLDIDTDKKSDCYGERVAEMTKNRFGVAGLMFPFTIESRGLKFREAKKTK